VALNIKNKEANELIEKLAKTTGENMTQAVTQAVRERLDRLAHPKKQGLAERLLRIGKDCASRLKGPARTIDHGEMLYDEKGLPR